MFHWRRELYPGQPAVDASVRFGDQLIAIGRERYRRARCRASALACRRRHPGRLPGSLRVNDVARDRLQSIKALSEILFGLRFLVTVISNERVIRLTCV